MTILRPQTPALSLLLLCLCLSRTAADGAAMAQEAEEAPSTVATQTPETPIILPIPEPQLETLEPSVAHQLTAARQLVQTVAQEGAQRQALAEAYGDLGSAYLAYEFRDSAEPCFHNARQLNPLDLRWPYYLGHLALDGGRPVEAEAFFVLALKIQSDHVPSLYYLAKALVEQQKTETAVQVLENALQYDPACTAATALLGEIALAKKDYEEAAQYLQQALAEQPAADRLYYPLGLAYRGLGRREEARETLARRGAVGVRPDDALLDRLVEMKEGERVHILRGRMAYRFGRFDEAAAAFQEALEANPESIAARVNLGSAMVYRGDTQAAIQQFTTVLEKDPDNRSARFNLGTLAASAGNWTEVESQMRTVLKADEGDVEARRWLADALRGQGRSDEALLEYARTVDRNPFTVQAQLGLASLLVERERYPEALHRLNSAHQLMPEDGRIVYPLAMMLAACPNPALRDGERALQLAQALLQAQPTVGNVRLLASALAENGRCKEAEDWQRKALETAAAAADASAAEAILADLRRYQAGPPCRPPVSQAQEPASGEGRAAPP